MIKYTINQIAGINQQNKGIKDRFYEDVEGFIYRGLSNGRLFKYVKCSEVSIDEVSIQDLGANVCEVLVNLDGRVVDLNADVNTRATKAELAKVKCLTISMAAAL